MTHLLTVTTVLSERTAAITHLVTRYLGDQLDRPVEFADDIPWPEREQQLDAGQIHLAWMCGLPYTRRADQPHPPIELLAAPVMPQPRYQQRPIYFSDVIVRRESAVSSFADLRGATWAYTEPHSHSGYNLTRYHLARLNETSGYFGQVVEAGSHLRALEMVLTGQVEATAIDSTVLEMERQARPDLQTKIRLIDTLGPSPIPPWVISRTVPPDLRQTIRRLLLAMHHQPAGQALLDQGQILKLVPVEDRDYDPIREMARLAQSVHW